MKTSHFANCNTPGSACNGSGAVLSRSVPFATAPAVKSVAMTGIEYPPDPTIGMATPSLGKIDRANTLGMTGRRLTPVLLVGTTVAMSVRSSKSWIGMPCSTPTAYRYSRIAPSSGLPVTAAAR